MVSDTAIKVTLDGKEYTLNYDLTGKPIFSLEIPIQKGMSYEEFKKQTNNINLPMIGYLVVCNIQRVEFKDAGIYYTMSCLEAAMSGYCSGKPDYIIVSDGVTIDGGTDNQKVIKESEFGEKVIEYVNDTYKDKQTITDTASGLNSFECVIEKKM